MSVRPIHLMLALAIVAASIATTWPADAQEEPPRVNRVGVAELSPEAERAIERGLRYLAQQQQADGSFGGRFSAANTAVVLMAYMVQGHFPDRGEHGEMLSKGIDYLVETGKRQNGYLGGNHHGMYEHGLATLALSEAWGESDRTDIRDALKAAVDVIFRAQHSSGGWRYEPRPTSEDISVSVMQIVALASAKEAGILVPDKVIDDAVKYVKACQNPFDGGFSYQLRQNKSGFARSAAGTMALMITGNHDSVEVDRGMDYLLRAGDSKFVKVDFHYYAHYYAIQAMYQAGARYYQDWYPQIRDRLVKTQSNNGRWRGGRGDDTYSTGMAILILGVPYRFLPIYQR